MKQQKSNQRIEFANQQQSMGTMGDLLRKAGIYTSTNEGDNTAEPSALTVTEKKTADSFSKDRIRIRLERKHRGGKTVTIIEGLPENPDRLAKLLKNMKTGLGCGGAIEADAIVLQGDMRDRARAWIDTHVAMP
jgi:predicted translation initiation factor SUI1